MNLCLDSVSFEWIEFTEMDLISKSGESEQWNGFHRVQQAELNLNSLPSNISLLTPPFCCIENDSEKVTLVFFDVTQLL